MLFPKDKGRLRDIVERARDKGFLGMNPRRLPLDVMTGATDESEGAKTMRRGGKVKASSASKRADGCATKGKTKGRFV